MHRRHESPQPARGQSISNAPLPSTLPASMAPPMRPQDMTQMMKQQGLQQPQQRASSQSYQQTYHTQQYPQQQQQQQQQSQHFPQQNQHQGQLLQHQQPQQLLFQPNANQQYLHQQRNQAMSTQQNPILQPTLPSGLPAPNPVSYVMNPGISIQPTPRDRDAMRHAMALVAEAARAKTTQTNAGMRGTPTSRQQIPRDNSSNRAFPQSQLIYSNTGPSMNPILPQVSAAAQPFTNRSVYPDSGRGAPTPMLGEKVQSSDILSELDSMMKATGPGTQVGQSSPLGLNGTLTSIAPTGGAVKANYPSRQTSASGSQMRHDTAVSSARGAVSGIPGSMNRIEPSQMTQKEGTLKRVRPSVVTNGAGRQQNSHAVGQRNLANYHQNVEAAKAAAAKAAFRFNARSTERYPSSHSAPRHMGAPTAESNLGRPHPYAAVSSDPEVLKRNMEERKEEQRAQILAEQRRLRLDRAPRNDQFKALNPDYKTPFKNKVDAWQRLIAYHVFLPNDREEEAQKKEFQETKEKLAEKYAQWTARLQSDLRERLRRFDDSEFLSKEREDDGVKDEPIVEDEPVVLRKSSDETETSLTPAEEFFVLNTTYQDEARLRDERLREEEEERARVEAQRKAEEVARLEQVRLAQAREEQAFLEQSRMKQEQTWEQPQRIQAAGGFYGTNTGIADQTANSQYTNSSLHRPHNLEGFEVRENTGNRVSNVQNPALYAQHRTPIPSGQRFRQDTNGNVNGMPAHNPNAIEEIQSRRRYSDGQDGRHVARDRSTPLMPGVSNQDLGMGTDDFGLGNLANNEDQLEETGFGLSPQQGLW